MNHLNSVNQSMATGQKLASAPVAQPVDESLARLEKQVVALRDVLDRVHFRLEPVITPASPTHAGAKGEESQPQTAPLVTKIDALTHFVASACYDLQEIDRRLAI